MEDISYSALNRNLRNNPPGIIAANSLENHMSDYWSMHHQGMHRMAEENIEDHGEINETMHCGEMREMHEICEEEMEEE